MQLIYDMIHKIAEETFGKPIAINNLNEYSLHWIETAKSIRDNFEKQGLVLTAKVCQEIIDFNLTLIR